MSPAQVHTTRENNVFKSMTVAGIMKTQKLGGEEWVGVINSLKIVFVVRLFSYFKIGSDILLHNFTSKTAEMKMITKTPLSSPLYNTLQMKVTLSQQFMRNEESFSGIIQEKKDYSGET